MKLADSGCSTKSIAILVERLDREQKMSAARRRDSARPAHDDRREPSYGRDRGRDRGYPDDYDRRDREDDYDREEDYDREDDYDREQGRQDYDEWDRDEEYDDRDRTPPNKRGGNRYDRDDGYGSRDRRDSRDRGYGGRDDDYYERDSRDRRYSRDRARSTPDFSKHRSSSIAEISRGMSERKEMGRCA